MRFFNYDSCGGINKWHWAIYPNRLNFSVSHPYIEHGDVNVGMCLIEKSNNALKISTTTIT